MNIKDIKDSVKTYFVNCGCECTNLFVGQSCPDHSIVEEDTIMLGPQDNHREMEWQFVRAAPSKLEVYKPAIVSFSIGARDYTYGQNSAYNYSHCTPEEERKRDFRWCRRMNHEYLENVFSIFPQLRAGDIYEKMASRSGTCPPREHQTFKTSS